MLTFWIIAGVIGVLVALTLALPLLRGRGAVPGGGEDLQVYRDQLAEVARDQARGTLGEQEAAHTRLEISRRLLAADGQAAAPERDQSRRARQLSAGVLIVALLGAALLVYDRIGAPGYRDLPLASRLADAEAARRARPAQAIAEAEVADSLPRPTGIDPEHAALMEKLRAALADRPQDLEGHRLLARNEAALGNFAAAYAAQNQVILIEGTDATAQDFGDLAELMIQAAGGYVSPEAERALAEALRRNSALPSARYYTGLMFAQNDRPDMAFRFWRPLAEEGDAGSPFTAAARENIVLAAQAAGERYELPARAALPGPSADDMAAAADMTDEERAQMVRGMVDGLMDRLATDGGTPAEWARLITALGVLGDTDRARAILAEARTTFADNAEALSAVNAAASQAGLDE